MTTQEVAFDAVDPRYEALYERACAVLGGDPRVVRVDVHGSIAAGNADKWSDLDLKVVVRDDAVAEFLNDWLTWMGEITSTVLLARLLFSFVIHSITDDGLTFDVSVRGESAPEWTPPPGFTVGTISGQRFTEFAPAVEYTVQERLRCLAGPAIRFAKRGDHVAHLSGLGHTMGLLMTVLLAENEVVPQDFRHPERNLTAEQRSVRVVATGQPDVRGPAELRIGDGVRDADAGASIADALRTRVAQCARGRRREEHPRAPRPRVRLVAHMTNLFLCVAPFVVMHSDGLRRCASQKP